VFLPNASQFFTVDSHMFATLAATAAVSDEPEILAMLAELGILSAPLIDDVAPQAPAVRALSLAIAQKCNLGCTYCYAQQGEFGGGAKSMSAEMALRAVDLLFQEAEAGARVNLAFLGGEPLANRAGVRAATEHAARLAAAADVDVRFSITTNGTLLTPEDGDFFERHGFAVTISLDGIGNDHDRQRSFK